MKNRNLVQILGAAVAAVLISFMASSPASAVTYYPANTYDFTNNWGWRCLDGGAATLGTPVQLWTCNGTKDQQWTLVSMGKGAYQIKSQLSGGCLGTYASQTGNGARVRTLPCSGNAEVLWTANAPSSQGWGFSHYATGRMLEACGSCGSYDGTPVEIWDSNLGSNQIWSSGRYWS